MHDCCVVVVIRRWNNELLFDSGCLYIAALGSAGALNAGAFVADALSNLASFADIQYTEIHRAVVAH